MSGIVAGIVVQVLEAAAGLLGNAIKDVLSKSKEFKPRLKQLKSTVDRMTPIFKDIERLNQEGHWPETESMVLADQLLVLADQLLEGESLVLKCAGVRWWNKSSYTNKLIDYDRSLTRFFQIDVTAQILHSVRRVEKNLAGKKEKKKEEEKKPDEKMKDAPPGVPRPRAEVDYGAVEDPIALLRNSPQFQALRPLLQKNPRLLELTLQGLRENPDIFGRNKEHEAAFRKLIDEPVDGSDGHLFDQHEQEMPHAIYVSLAEQETPHTISVILAEQEAIERLEEMGFDSDLVIEAFLACDGNEELAVNYLLENAGYFED